MMSDSKVVPFLFDDEMLVRVEADENGDLWFAAVDVCRILEIKNVTRALSGLDPDEVRLRSRDFGADPLHTMKGSTNGLDLNEVSEAGLYALIMRSRKPNARRFDRWVRHEVLPALRKKGSFALPGRGQDQEESRPDPTMALKAINEARLTYGARAAQQIWLRFREMPVVPAMLEAVIAQTRQGELDLHDDEALRTAIMERFGMSPDGGALH